MTVVECLECGGDITLHEDVEIGEIIDCTTCGIEIEIIETDPIVIDHAPELEEDWGE